MINFGLILKQLHSSEQESGDIKIVMGKATDKQSFFLPGDCKDRGYRNVRDNPLRPEWRTFVGDLWSRYHELGIEDPHFLEDAMNHFLERYWEMYLAVTLNDRGFKLKRYGNEGPEFYFENEGRKVWVEAVAPGPGEGEDRVPEISYGEVQTVPTEKILLRFTNALDEKRIKYNKAVRKKIIAYDDLYILAINSRGIPHAPLGNTLPFFVHAFLPFGNLTALIDTKTRKIVETFYQKRENIIKAKGAAVSTTAFLDTEFSFVSAALHSGVDCANHPACLGEDFIILHNHTTTHPLDPDVFHWCQQIFYHDGQLEFKPDLK
jgi:hypothetical protein